ncbi:hypothetical protein [Owenweeksia hongkongensis]|uniref:hypothetical protein n=1 Tax=Owenweeksia hongkongensis TaxID=253245 RepID=UPI003A94F54A
MRKPSTLLFLISICFSLNAQTNLDKAKEQLHELKNGVLLVRLFTNDAKISGLEAAGKTSEANKTAQAQQRENKDILLSFSQVFQFCPVFFFYSDDSEYIRNGNFDGKIFDSSLTLVDPSEITGTVFTAEFSETENLGIEGLIIMDDQLFPLEAPFPFYQRKYTVFGVVSLTKSRMVHRLNNKLRDTYKLWFPEAK